MNSAVCRGPSMDLTKRLESSVVTCVRQLDAALRHEHIVFNSDAAPAWKVRTRLDREHHARSDECSSRASTSGRRGTIRGIFVNLDPQPVAGAVSERLAHSGRRQASRAPRRRWRTASAPGLTAAIALDRGPRAPRVCTSRAARRRPSDAKRSASGRRSMSRRRRQSPARRGHLRSTFARSVWRAAAPRWGRWRRSSRTPVAGNLRRACGDRSRNANPRSVIPASTRASTIRGDRKPLARFPAGRRSRSRPSRPARASTIPSVGTSSTLAAPDSVSLEPLEAVDGQVRGLESDARPAALARSCASARVVRAFHDHQFEVRDTPTASDASANRSSRSASRSESTRHRRDDDDRRAAR